MLRQHNKGEARAVQFKIGVLIGKDWVLFS